MPIANYQLLIANCQLQNSNCILPIANCRLTIGNRQFLIAYLVNKKIIWNSSSLNIFHILVLNAVQISQINLKLPFFRTLFHHHLSPLTSCSHHKLFSFISGIFRGTRVYKYLARHCECSAVIFLHSASDPKTKLYLHNLELQV